MFIYLFILYLLQFIDNSIVCGDFKNAPFSGEKKCARKYKRNFMRLKKQKFRERQFLDCPTVKGFLNYGVCYFFDNARRHNKGKSQKYIAKNIACFLRALLHVEETKGQNKLNKKIILPSKLIDISVLTVEPILMQLMLKTIGVNAYACDEEIIISYENERAKEFFHFQEKLTFQECRQYICSLPFHKLFLTREEYIKIFKNLFDAFNVKDTEYIDIFKGRINDIQFLQNIYSAPCNGVEIEERELLECVLPAVYKSFHDFICIKWSENVSLFERQSIFKDYFYSLWTRALSDLSNESINTALINFLRKVFNDKKRSETELFSARFLHELQQLKIFIQMLLMLQLTHDFFIFHDDKLDCAIESVEYNEFKQMFKEKESKFINCPEGRIKFFEIVKSLDLLFFKENYARLLNFLISRLDKKNFLLVEVIKKVFKKLGINLLPSEEVVQSNFLFDNSNAIPLHVQDSDIIKNMSLQDINFSTCGDNFIATEEVLSKLTAMALPPTCPILISSSFLSDFIKTLSQKKIEKLPVNEQKYLCAESPF